MGKIDGTISICKPKKSTSEEMFIFSYLWHNDDGESDQYVNIPFTDWETIKVDRSYNYSCALLQLNKVTYLDDFPVHEYIQIAIVLNLMPDEMAILQVYEAGDTFHSGLQNLQWPKVEAVFVHPGTVIAYNLKQIVSLSINPNVDHCWPI